MIRSRSTRPRALLAALIALALAALACNLPGGAEPTPTATPTEEVAEATEETASPPPDEAEETEQPTEEATEEPTEEPTEESADGGDGDSGDDGGTCTYSANYVADVTVPDGTEFEPGETFTKTWRVRSDGCITWPTGSKLVFQSGDQMGGPSSVNLPDAGVGASVEVSVNLTAPDDPGDYRGYWTFQAPGGARFGGRVFVDIAVTEPAGDGGATEEPTEEPADDQPDLEIIQIRLDPTLPRHEEEFDVVVTVKNNGGAQAPASKLHLEVDGSDDEGEIDIPALGAGNSHEARFELDLEKGDYTLDITADNDDDVDESDEDNNELEEDITVYEVTVLREGSVNRASGDVWDLDSGTGSSGSSSNDLRWHGDYLGWLNDAGGALHGGSAPSLDTCFAASVSSADVDADDIDGTYYCVKTSQDNVGWISVDVTGSEIELGYKIWELDDD